jgi:opacity protein-like surface antigen
MKKLWLIAGCVLAVAGLSPAAGIEFGGHGSFTAGGDIEDEESGYGGQIVARVNDTVSLELSGTRFDDEGVDLELTSLALSLRLSTDTADNTEGYIAGGANYNMFDFDSDPDPDDEIGFHAAAGLEFLLGESFRFFIEYRYNFVEYTVDRSGDDVTISDLDVEYEFGLARAGINIIL